MATFTGRVAVVIGGREVLARDVVGAGLLFSSSMAREVSSVKADLFGKCDNLSANLGARCVCIGRSPAGDAIIKAKGFGRLVASIVVAVQRVD